MPVLRRLAPGVRLLAVAVAEPGLIRKVIDPPGIRSPYWSIMSGEPQLDVDALLDDQVERLAVEDVGRVHDRMRIAVGPVARGQCAADLPGTDGIDQDAVAADQVGEWRGLSSPSARYRIASNGLRSPIRSTIVAAS